MSCKKVSERVKVKARRSVVDMGISIGRDKIVCVRVCVCVCCEIGGRRSSATTNLGI